MRLSQHILKACLLAVMAAGLLASLAVVPAQAQEVAPADNPAGTAREAELRAWWDSLPEHRQRQLLHRRRALKRLPSEQQEALIDRARQDKPVLTEQQRERLERLRNLTPMQRLRLYTLAAEIHALRRSDPRGLRQAMQKTGKERTQHLRALLTRQRMVLYAQSLTEEEQQRLREMQPNERVRFFMQKKRALMEKLVSFYPRVRELGEMAKSGDEQAKRELRQVMGDLLTLSMLIQRLSPELQKKALSEIQNLSIEKAAEVIRRTLQQQWKDEMRRRKNDPRRNNQRDRARPEERGDRSRRNDRRRD